MDSSQNSTRPSKNQNQYYSNYFVKYKRKALFQTLYEVSMILISKTLINIDTTTYKSCSRTLKRSLLMIKLASSRDAGMAQHT